MTWPPNYKIRRSKRARYLRLIIRPDVSVEIVIPLFVAKAEGLHFLEQKRDWVLQQLQRVQEQKLLKSAAQESITLPDELHLRALEQCWQLQYQSDFSLKRVKIRKLSSDQLYCQGNVDDQKGCFDALASWLLQCCHAKLTPQLIELAKCHRFNVQRIGYRFQKTLWGSCSRGGNISLNAKLLFLPAELAHYVMIHELCHLRHMNHSKRFWQCVAKYVPDYKRCEKELRVADHFVPQWLSDRS